MVTKNRSNIKLTGLTNVLQKLNAELCLYGAPTTCLFSIILEHGPTISFCI